MLHCLDCSGCKMKVLYLLATIAVGTTAQTCHGSDSDFRNGNLAFSGKVYRELLKEDMGNILVSPLSLAMALTLLYIGARGQTAQEILAGGKFPRCEDDLLDAIEGLVNVSSLVGTPYLLINANKLYIDEDLTVNPKFKNLAADVFDIEVEKLDFSNVFVTTRKINEWVRNATQNRIKYFTNTMDMFGLKHVLLINAIYFDGFWKNPFDIEGSSDGTFYMNGAEKTTVKMMEQMDVFNYYEDEVLQAKFLRMHYEGDFASMTFILPNDKNGLEDLENNIDNVLLISDFSQEAVHLKLPQIDIEGKTDFAHSLKQMGILDAFSLSANFRGMVEERIFVPLRGILQKSVISVKERGTMGVSASEAEMYGWAANMNHRPSIKEFIADHPFIFVLSCNYGVIFIGRYIGPSALVKSDENRK